MGAPDQPVDKESLLRHVRKAARRRSDAELAERQAIRLAHLAGLSIREIASAADRAPATVGRMVQRNPT